VEAAFSVLPELDEEELESLGVLDSFEGLESLESLEEVESLEELESLERAESGASWLPKEGSLPPPLLEPRLSVL
jgi:hypothetical protein